MDLEEAGRRFGEVTWNEQKSTFTATCPNDSGHRVKVTLLAGAAFVRCLGGCDGKQLKAWLAAHTNGHVNGKVEHQEPPAGPDPATWKLRVYHAIADVLKADDEKGRGMLRSMSEDHLVESAMADALRGVAAGLFNPLPALSESEIDEEIASACRGAVRDFLGPRKAVPAVNGNGNGAITTEFELPPVLVRNTIEILRWSEMRARRSTLPRRQIVDRWLFAREISSWAGKVEHGKTTLMRELLMCVIRGEPFLGHATTRGRVFYAMLDADGEDLTYDEFQKLGFGSDPEDEERTRFIFEPNLAGMKNGPEQFFKILWEWRPDLVIIDPFARLKTIGDFNDYNNTYLMGMISEYAKRIDAHFALPGHIPRGRPPGAEAATAQFGSISFSAGVNARFVVERKEHSNIHVLRSSKGKSAGFEALEGAHVLKLNEMTGRIELGKEFSFGDQARVLKGPVREFLLNAPEESEFSAVEIAKSVGGMPGAVRAAAQMVFEDELMGEHRVIRSGTGKRGSPFKFGKPESKPKRSG